MKLQNAITMQLHTRKWLGTNHGEMVFSNYRDFKEVLRFLWDIKRSLYETDYQWQFKVSFIKEDMLIRIDEERGVEKNAGIKQCLDWLRRNGAEVNVHTPNITEKTPILPSCTSIP